MKPKTNRARKEKEIDKDTVVAYHDFIQGRIQGELNGLSIGPGRVLFKTAVGLVIIGLVFMVVGILVITLRHRHVYLWDWNAQFLGPFFIIVFLGCMAAATFLLILARKRTNDYRESLAFRPIGDYGVAVVHKSQLTYDEQKKSDLKSGTTPHNVRHPGRPGVNDRGHRGDYSKSGYDNRGYRYDNNGYREKRDRDYDSRDYGDRPDRRERRPDDRRERRPDDRPRGPRPDRPERRDRDRDDRRRPPDDDRRRREDDKRREAEGRGRRGDPDRDRSGERRRPPEEERRRAEARRRYEEDRRRAQLRKQAEADLAAAQSQGEERGVDVEGNRTVQVTTTVTLQHQGTDESEL